MSAHVCVVQARDWLSSYWSGYNSPSQLSRIRNTGVPAEVLKEVRSLSHAFLLPVSFPPIHLLISNFSFVCRSVRAVRKELLGLLFPHLQYCRLLPYQICSWDLFNNTVD